MARWRERAVWTAKTLLVALAIYVVSGALISAVIFGPGGGSSTASAVAAVAFAVVSLGTAVLLRVHGISLRDLNWEYEEWSLRRPKLAVAVIAIALALYFWSLNRHDFRSIPGGALIGVFIGWIGLRRSRERRGLAPSSTDDDRPSMDVRLDDWRLRHPALSILVIVVAIVAFCTMVGSRPIAVPVEIVVALVIGWTSLRHSRARHDLG